MYEKLLKTVTSLGSSKILVVGDFMVDVYIYGDATRISPEAPVPVLKVKDTKYSCGGAGSVVADISELGGKAICLGIVGDDNNSEILKELLEDHGADISGLVSILERPTISKERLIGLAQHRHQQQLFRMDHECTDPLTGEQSQRFLEMYEQKLAEADVVCLQDYNKGLLEADVCRAIIESAKKAGKKVLVDPAYVSDYSKYSGATLITPNRQEASRAVGFDITDTEKAAEAGKKLREQLGCGGIVITMDKEGAYLESGDFCGQIETRARNVYDVTGAGDMVLSMLAVTLGAGCNFETSVRLSNIAGGLEVEKFGVATVSIEEVIGEIIARRRKKKEKSGKVLSLEELSDEVRWHRMQKERIVFTNGCFDVVHRGHIEYLGFCKEQGDVLVVGMNSDESVRQIKGPERPINKEDDRASVLAAFEAVDYVVVFGEADPLELIKKVRPEVLIKGEDWAEKGVVGKEFVEGYGGEVVLAPLVEGKSSTNVIEKIKDIAAKINVFKGQKEGTDEQEK